MLEAIKKLMQTDFEEACHGYDYFTATNGKEKLYCHNKEMVEFLSPQGNYLLYLSNHPDLRTFFILKGWLC